MPLLLADALRTYGIANRRALAAAGFDDIPRAGARVVVFADVYPSSP